MPLLPLPFCLELILLSKTDNMAGCSLPHPAQAMNSSRGKWMPESGDVLVQWAEVAAASGSIRAEGPQFLKGREGELCRAAAINNNVSGFLCSDFFFFSRKQLNFLMKYCSLPHHH